MSKQDSPALVRKDTLYLTAVIALLVGFLAGALAATIYVTGPRTQGVASAPAPAPQQNAPAGGPSRAQRQRMLDLEMATAKNPDDLAAWVELGHLYFDTNQPADAVRAYEKALALNPDDPDVWTDLGVMYRRTGRPEKAVEAFDRAIALDPDHRIAHFNKGIVLIHDLARRDEGIASWRRVLDIDPDATAPNGTPLPELIERYENQ